MTSVMQGMRVVDCTQWIAFSTTQFEVRDSAGILYATGRATRRTLLVERNE